MFLTCPVSPQSINQSINRFSSPLQRARGGGAGGRHGRQQQRPHTSWPAQLRSSSSSSRRLGAVVCPTLRPGDLVREKAFFRSGTQLISSLLGSWAWTRSSAPWRAAPGAPPGGGGGGDSFCRSSLAESRMNDAEFAKVTARQMGLVFLFFGVFVFCFVCLLFLLLKQINTHKRLKLSFFLSAFLHRRGYSVCDRF